MEPWFKGIGPVSLFIEDLVETKKFYEDIFGPTAVFEDADSGRSCGPTTEWPVARVRR